MFDIAAFMTIASALDPQGVPPADAQDFQDGAQFIPGEVTLARRAGHQVRFDRFAHEWTFQDGRVIGRQS